MTTDPVDTEHATSAQVSVNAFGIVAPVKSQKCKQYPDPELAPDCPPGEVTDSSFRSSRFRSLSKKQGQNDDLTHPRWSMRATRTTISAVPRTCFTFDKQQEQLQQVRCLLYRCVTGRCSLEHKRGFGHLGLLHTHKLPFAQVFQAPAWLQYSILPAAAASQKTQQLEISSRRRIGESRQNCTLKCQLS